VWDPAVYQETGGESQGVETAELRILGGVTWPEALHQNVAGQASVTRQLWGGGRSSPPPLRFVVIIRVKVHLAGQLQNFELLAALDVLSQRRVDGVSFCLVTTNFQRLGQQLVVDCLVRSHV